MAEGNSLLALSDRLAGRFVERNDAGAIPFQGARVYNSAIETLTTGVTTLVTFDSERYDTIDCHSTTTATSRFTIPVAGYYHVGASLRWAANTTGRRIVQLQMNSTTTIARHSAQAVQTGGTHLTIGADYLFAAADYIEVTAYQDSGGNLDIEQLGNSTPEFWIHRIG